MMRRFRLKYKKGQSAAELAIFGSIVIFVIGMILKTSLSISHKSNIDLRVFRMAMRESYLTANGQYSGEFSGGRNSSNILLIEDRLTIDPSKKQGTRDRMPAMAQASGTMTHSLMMPINQSDVYDQAVFDMFINGQRFPLTVAAVQVHRICTNTNIDPLCTYNVPPCQGYDYGPIFGTCYTGNITAPVYHFFRRLYNGEDGWDSTCDSCFDLDFDGIADVPSGPDPKLALNIRDVFAWQWAPIGVGDLVEGFYVDVDGDLKEELILRDGVTWNGLNTVVTIHTLDSQAGDIDLTADEQTEELYIINQLALGVASPKFQMPGLGQEVKAFSFTKDGTLLENREGELFKVSASGGQFVRNETRQDHLDIIERIIHLSNDTGRFCRTANVPADWHYSVAAIQWAREQGLRGMVNPVEACGNCFSDVDGVDHRKLTCMDTAGPTIFVRSRIRDRRRSVWVTRTQDRQ